MFQIASQFVNCSLKNLILVSENMVSINMHEVIKQNMFIVWLLHIM